ncbi:MAG: DUF4287 domain-containing protein, partial [Fimbriimonadaceae bacterium]|nr:DUF4287 domain-containing protein [Fimbriimonadaceae bacterium]
MSDALQKALETQIKNIEAKTGLSLAELGERLAGTGLAKHGELRTWAMENLGIGHGDANTLVHLWRQAESEPEEADPLEAIYAGKKAALRPIHEALMARILEFGEFEIAPKKANVSLRRKKQFALIGPATATRFEVGINLKTLDPTDRLKALPPGGMCPFKV